MKKTGTTRRSKKAFEPRSLSDADVARYLRQLVAMHKDKRTGNPALAMALKRLVDRLEGETSNREEQTTESQPEMSAVELRSLDPEAVRLFLDDPLKTKVQLIALGIARFSIPSSKLLRMKLDDVRDALNASLQHENSLSIIGEEAERHGLSRKS